ncbi:hypothetical protein PT974_09074 [Cladobotryum mycophilum]|uniref:Uncharacterized protein n=1 Tax=Cladobotryum mycophilum TaxID=491253 RepID=A0ABR0SGJ3_9HYPO
MQIRYTISWLPRLVANVLLSEESLLLALSQPATASATDSVHVDVGPVGAVCSPEGLWNCLEQSWQRCASGQWSVVVRCSNGTICQPLGLTDNLSIRYASASDDSPSPRDEGEENNNGSRYHLDYLLLATAVLSSKIIEALGVLF